jgi:hypothetical protein
MLFPCARGWIVDSSVLTGLGLAPSAGLNAYIPLLVLALADRFTNQVTLQRPYDFLSSNTGIIILLALLTVEIIADKIPGVDHANDLIQSAIRPAAGAVSMMAITNTDRALNPAVAMIAGLLLAGGVHGVKATTRPAITVSTGGVGNPVISMIEDAVATITSITAVLAPVIALALLILFAVVLWWLYRKIRNFTGYLARLSRASSLNKRTQDP